jgi:tetratricopeptide (TPR) repeat protein
MLKTILIIALASFLVLAQQSSEFSTKYVLAQSYLQGGQYDKAEQIFEDLYKTQPDNYQIFSGLNDSYVQQKKYDQSISLLENRIKIDPQNINLYGMLGSTYYLMGNDKKAFEIWDNSLDKVSNNVTAYRILANYAIERRAFDKAIEYLKKGKAAAKTNNYFSYDLANLYSLTMQFKNAAEEYCSIIDNNPQQLSAIQSRIMAYINKPGALDQTIEAVKEYKSDKIEFKYLLAALYKEAKDYDKALNLYEQIESMQDQQGYLLLNFANFLTGEKQFTIATQVYDEIISRFPNSPFLSSVKLGYAKTLEASLDDDSVLNANNWKPYSKPTIVSNEKIERVINAYSEIIKSYPHSEVSNEALLRIADILLSKKGNTAEAQKYFEELTAYPSSQLVFDAYLKLGDIAVQSGNLDQAVLDYSKVLENKGSPINKKNLAKLGLAKINFYKNDFQKSKDLLSEIINDLNDNSTNNALELSLILSTSKNDSADLVRFSSAELLAEQMKYDSASVIYKSIYNNPRAFVLGQIAEIRDAEMDLAMDSLDTAIAKFSKIEAEGAKNIYADKALYLEGQAYQFGLKDNSKAIETYEKLLANFPNSIYLDEVRKIIISLKSKLS